MIETEAQLREVLDETTPALEQALAASEFAGDLPESLQLRYSLCGLACAALQKHLHERYDLKTSRLLHVSNDSSLRGVNGRRQTHVVLRTESSSMPDTIIDPTYSQFMSYLGLTPRVAHRHHLVDLYPSTKIAVFPASDASRFTKEFSRHADTVWNQHGHEIPEPDNINPTHKLLRNAGGRAIESTFDHLWDLSLYRDLSDKEQPEGLLSAADRVSQALVEPTQMV